VEKDREHRGTQIQVEIYGQTSRINIIFQYCPMLLFSSWESMLWLPVLVSSYLDHWRFVYKFQFYNHLSQHIFTFAARRESGSKIGYSLKKMAGNH